MEKLSKKVFQNPLFFLAFGFGSGLIPFAPGTWGSIAAIPLFLLLSTLPCIVYLSVTAVLFCLGIYLCKKVIAEIHQTDPPGLVFDEIVGYLLTMTCVPPQLPWIISGFLLFRIFDIWKPQPIRFVDKHIKGGLGIMLDDCLAAIPAWLILHGLIWTFNQ